MKPGGVRGLLLGVSLALIFGIGVPVGRWLESSQRDWMEARTEAALTRTAAATVVALEAHRAELRPAVVDPLADRLGAAVGARVTVVAPDGTVLGDSAVEREALAAQQNQKTRPEIADAIATGAGVSRRLGAGDTEWLYVARVGPGGAIVRVGQDFTGVYGATQRLRILLWVFGLSGIGVALLMSLLAGRVASRAATELGTLSGSYDRVSDALQKATRALTRERDRLQAVLEAMNDAVVAVDREMRVRLANPAARRLLRLSPEPEGRPLLDQVRVPALHDLVVKGRDSTRTQEFDGPSGRRLVGQAAPMPGGGSVVGIHDVTEIRRLERVRKDFIDNVSHELRTPVSIIRLNAETLVDGAASDPVHGPRMLAAIHRNAERLAALIDDILDLSRIEAGKTALNMGPVSVHKVAARVLDGLQDKAERRQITFETSVPPALRVQADPKALEQVLTNLVDNAVKYGEEGGRVWLSAEAVGRDVCLTVADDGSGIEPRQRGRVFERFYRVDKGRSRDVGGTGLGLAICKHLTEAMDGTIGVAGREPRGTAFHVTLPVVL